MGKKRKGAFWEDRYHATAVESGEHLFRCLVYLDMNMVRAGVVRHPKDWPTGGYREIQNPPERYEIIDREWLSRLLGFTDVTSFQKQHQDWISQALADNSLERDMKWSESIAVGSEQFVHAFSESLTAKAGKREIVQINTSYVIRDAPLQYNIDFGGKKPLLRPNNTHVWKLTF